MKSRIRACCFARKAFQCAIVFCFVLFLPYSAFAQDIWSSPPFSATSADLLKAAVAVPAPEGSDEIILLDEVKYVFTEDGTCTYSSRLIFRLLTPAGAKSWTTVRSSWRIWREEKPQIRARVITADGTAHELDPKTIGEAPVDDRNPDIFSDQRMVHAPLPAVGAGSVVEQEIVIPGKKSLLSNGSVHAHYFGSNILVERTRVTIDAPAVLPLHYKTLLLDSVRPRRIESGNRVQLVFETGRLDPLKQSEPYLPPDVLRWPLVAFSTGKSWQDVARRYNEILEQQIRIPEVQSLVSHANLAGKSREEKIAALLALLQKEVRYTGVEFGEASWVPRTPSETLERKYGDCKDKASLMAAMLRASGIPAHLALLTTARDGETLPDLPGLGHFDHAIVFVPGSPETWIDVTSEYSRPGQIPLADQGRLALVIRPETTALVKTPESSSTDNRLVETREFFLPERGPARVVETTESFGSVEVGYRGYYAAADPKEVQSQFREYGKNTYDAEEQSPAVLSDPADMSSPFRIRIEMPKATRGITGPADAAVAILVSLIAQRLPNFSTRVDEPEDAQKPDIGEEKKKSAKRVGELLLPEPFVVEWRYTITPPPGYKSRPLPESARKEIGPALLTRQYALSPDGVITAIFRFDTRKRRLTPKEADDLTAGIEELNNEEAVLLIFDQVGEALLQEGKIREALNEFKRLAAMHPKEALHHTQIARALLVTGIGEAAREEARRAVGMEPESAVAYDTLGWVSEHDLIGRRLRKGMDLEGAIAARRKSVALDPQNTEYKLSLAIVLEHDQRCERYKGKGLKEAIEIYKSIAEKLKGTEAENNLRIAQMFAGQFEDLKKDLQTAGEIKDKTALTLVAIAATEGPAAAIRKAAQLESTEDARLTVLRSAGQILIELRMYPQGAELLKSGARGISNAAAELSRAALIAKVQRREDIKHSDSDPRGTFLQFVSLLFEPEIREQDVLAVMSRFGRDRFDSKKDMETITRAQVSMRGLIAQTGAVLDVVADLLFSSMEFHMEGDDSIGYRVGGRLMDRDLTALMAKEGNHFVILGVDDGLEDVGHLVLELVRKGERDKARVWLDRAREQIKLAGGDDPLSGRAFPRLWNKGQEGSPEQMEMAAAALLSTGEEVELSAPILLKARSAASTDALRTSLDLALIEAYGKAKKWGDALPFALRLAAVFPNSETAFSYLTQSQMAARRWKDCEQSANNRLKAFPNDLEALRALRKAAEGQLDWKKASLISAQIAASGKADFGDYNDQAWITLFDGTVDEKALEIAQRATRQTQNREFASLHTLAAIHAELGHTSEAREVLLHGMDVGGIEEPDSSCWYVFGRIAEHFGEMEAAVNAYKKVEMQDEEEISPAGNYPLAQKRIKILQKLP